MDQVRLFALGGLDEDGKNMYVVEVGESIFVIEAGLKYPESTDQLGIERIIPDFKYLIENQHRIQAIFISHGHDDVMAALPNLLRHVKAPVYSTPLTAMLIEEMLKKEGLREIRVHRVKRNSSFKIAGIPIRTFGMTQSIADGFGLSIETPQGAIVYTSEYIVDYDIHNDAFSCDITALAEIGKRGVLALMTESVGADREGHSAPHHRITEFVEPAFEDAEGRIIITTYHQNLYRIIEIIELANKYNRKVIFYDDDLRAILKAVEKMGYYRMPIGLEIPKSKFTNELKDVVVIVSGSGDHVFRRMHKVALGEDAMLRLNGQDTVVIASPVVPGTEREATNMENELYKENVRVVTLDRRKVYSMHASIEDLKMMLYLFKPTYYMPIKGEYRQLVSNANIALNMGYHADKILVLDNGQIAKFVDGVLKSTADQLTLEDVLIDVHENLDVSGMVLRDREILSTDGAIIVGIVVNHKTKEVIGGPDVQSRGVIYLKDADHIVKEIGNIIERTVEDAVKEKRYENMAVRMEAKDRIVKYVLKETGKRPMILPAIVEINVTE